MLSPKQQAFELLNKSQNILIVLPNDYTADGLGSGLALMLLAQALNKKVDLVAQEPVPEKLSFLPGLERLKAEPTALRDFIISIDTSQNKIKQLRYETKESILKIFLSSQGKLEQKDIRLEPGPFIYDLAVTIDAPDLESLGQFYERYTELFFAKPILNIDHQSANEYYGEVNLVDSTASSCAEILTDFFNSFFSQQITPEVATCLLAGIIEETRSFQKAGTTPQTFNLASLLITQGAEKEKIIQSLYKTKPLNYLKLWGRMLARLDYAQEKNLAWLEARPEDFKETQTSADDLPSISDEVHDMLPQLNASVIFWSNEPDLVLALVQSPHPDLLQKLNIELSGSIKNNQASFKIIGSDIEEAKTKLQSLLNSLL